MSSENYRIGKQDSIYFHSPLVANEGQGKERINYIHENPVRTGIVAKTEDYLFSSARNYANLSAVIEIDLR